MAVGKTISDPAFGDSVKILTEVRHLPNPDGSNPSSEVVAVKMTVRNSAKYTSGMGAFSFNLHAAGSDIAPFNDSKPYIAEMKQHHYMPMLPDDVPSGKTKTGWLPFLIYTADAKTIVFQYKREKTTVLGSNKSIPAKTFSIVLPAK